MNASRESLQQVYRVRVNGVPWLLCLPWISAFAAMMDEEVASLRHIAGKHDRPGGPGV